MFTERGLVLAVAVSSAAVSSACLGPTRCTVSSAAELGDGHRYLPGLGRLLLRYLPLECRRFLLGKGRVPLRLVLVHTIVEDVSIGKRQVGLISSRF